VWNSAVIEEGTNWGIWAKLVTLLECLDFGYSFAATVKVTSEKGIGKVMSVEGQSRCSRL